MKVTLGSKNQGHCPQGRDQMGSLFTHILLGCWKEPRHPLRCKRGFYGAETSSPTSVPEIVIIKAAKKSQTQKRIVGMTFDTQSELKANTQKIHKYTESSVGRSSAGLSGNVVPAQVVKGL